MSSSHDSVADAGSASCLLRAVRKRLNLTQREFGILLSPGGVSPISPSVICQLESALQVVPVQVIARATTVDAAIQRFGEHLAAHEGFSDTAHALKSLGPGCIEKLATFAHEQTVVGDAELVGEFLAIVTRRKKTAGGSRPGARGPYRKLSKLNNFGVDATPTSVTVADTDPTGDSPKAEVVASGFTHPSAASAAMASPCSLLSSLSLASASLSSTPRSEVSSRSELSSRSEVSSQGSSRPRSPLGSDVSSEAGAGESPQQRMLSALKRLQEENDKLQNENKRLRSLVDPNLDPCEC